MQLIETSLRQNRSEDFASNANLDRIEVPLQRVKPTSQEWPNKTLEEILIPNEQEVKKDLEDLPELKKIEVTKQPKTLAFPLKPNETGSKAIKLKPLENPLLQINDEEFDADFFTKDLTFPDFGKSKKIEEDKEITQSLDTKEKIEESKGSAPFNFDQLEDMGEIIDIGFDDDLDPDSYLQQFKPKKQTKNIGDMTFKNHKIVKQSFEKSKDTDTIQSLSSAQLREKSQAETISQNMANSEISLQQISTDSLSLHFKKTKSHNVWNEEISIGETKDIDILNNKQKDQILMHLLKERGDFKEKLRIAENEMMQRNSHSIGMEGNLHLAFLFSSPLIRRTNSSIENISQLDYLTEINDILRVCSRRKYEIKYKIDVATVSNLRSTITDCPIALHFSGHGIENTLENLGNEYALFKDKGNILLLEDEHGMADYFYEEDLKYMVQMSQNTFEVVFVSSCYSQFAGEVFLNAGAKHVIWIKSGERISDKASLRFSRVFYETLFVKNYNVWTSFEIAKEEINKVINASEANKFLLLIRNDSDDEHSWEHTWYSISNFKPGALTNIDYKPVFDSVPSNVECFIGRQQDMYEAINLLDYHRLVSILGPPGIGKTSLARNLANYLKDRKKYNDGIIYVALRGWESAQMFLTRLWLLIRTAWSIEDYKKYGLEEIEKKSNVKNNQVGIDKDDESKYRSWILHMLREKEVLLVLDNAEDPLEDDTTNFVNELDFIIDNCPKIKFLVTTRKTINKLAHNHEKPYILQPLSKEASLKLLIAKAPRDIKNQELQELLVCTLPKHWKISQALNIKFLNPEQKWTLLDHPFTALLGGHPQAISLAAPLLEYKPLKRLFYDFWDSNLMDAIDCNSLPGMPSSFKIFILLSPTLISIPNLFISRF